MKGMKRWKGCKAALKVGSLLCILALAGQTLPAERCGQNTGDVLKAEVCAAEIKNQAEPLDPDAGRVLSSVYSYILSTDTNPDFSSTWNVVGITRSGLSAPADYTDIYYKNVIGQLDEKNWVLSRTKYTEYSKLIIGMTAIGKDAQNIAGHNLLSYLSDFSDVKRQGFNGPIWALIALNSHPSYEIPVDPDAKQQTTEEGLISYILGEEKPGGGWTLSGNEADADITGMTVQALAPYYEKEGYGDVTAAIDRALSWLSAAQLESGGYATGGTETSESVSQVIVALSALGIDGMKDSRFIKNGKSPMAGLFQYYLPQGGFMHVAAGAGNNGGGDAGTLNGMATEQGMYATAAYKRMLEGKTALYDMSDITLTAGSRPAASPSDFGSAGRTPGGAGTSLETKVTKIVLDYKSVTLEKGETKKLTAAVYPSNASNKKVVWKSSDKDVAAVSKKGKVNGKKEGKATITVKAADGSGQKAKCEVTVIDSKSGKTVKNTADGGKSTSSVRSTTKTAGNAAVKQTKERTQTDAAGETGGWSFSGEDYVPENFNSADSSLSNGGELENVSEESGRWADKTITIRIPIGPLTYAFLGAGGVVGIEALLWLIKKRRRLKKLS